MLCLSISQQPTIQYGTAASYASYSIFFQTGTWSHWLWNMFVIKVLPSPPVSENKARYDALRMASHTDQSWFLSCLISDVWSASDSWQKICLCWWPGHLALCKRLKDIRGNSYSGHGNSILLFLQMEAQAQYNKECVGRLPYLLQGGTNRHWSIPLRNAQMGSQSQNFLNLSSAKFILSLGRICRG